MARHKQYRKPLFSRLYAQREQKVTGGLKPIQGKQESRSQKRLPLSCFFRPAVSFAERIKSSKKYRKQSKKFVFITILVILCIIGDLSGERSAFQNIRGGEKGQSEDTAFLSRLFSPLGNFTESVCPRAECVCALPFRIFCCPFRTNGTKGSIINDGLWVFLVKGVDAVGFNHL